MSIPATTASSIDEFVEQVIEELTPKENRIFRFPTPGSSFEPSFVNPYAYTTHPQAHAYTASPCGYQRSPSLHSPASPPHQSPHLYAKPLVEYAPAPVERAPPPDALDDLLDDNISDVLNEQSLDLSIDSLDDSLLSDEQGGSQRQRSSEGSEGRRKRLRSGNVCPTCGKAFGNSSALAKHRLIHSGERKYICKLCQKAFKRQDHLNGHMMTHSSRKPFQCKVPGCDKSYCDSRSLKRHVEGSHQQYLASLAAGNIQALDYLPEIGRVTASVAGQKLTACIDRDQVKLELSKEEQQRASAGYMAQFSPISPGPGQNQSDQLRQQVWNLQLASQSRSVFTFEEPKQVECHCCGKMFRNAAALNGHMRLHGGYQRPPDEVPTEEQPVPAEPVPNPSETPRKVRPAPLVLPPPTFPSQLRSPRLPEKPGTPPPYTPPPMLSPMRKGPGLFAWNAVLRRSNSLLSRSLSSPEPCAPETDVYPHVNIGPQFQAVLPDAGDQHNHNSDKDLLLWHPDTASKLSDDELIAFTELCSSALLPGGGRNLELALHVLHVCGGDFERALDALLAGEMRGMPECRYAESSAWTREELTAFCTAIMHYDKDFFLVAREVPSKTVAECVELYYLWKKVCPDEYRRLRKQRRELEEANAARKAEAGNNSDDNKQEFDDDDKEDFPCRVCGKVFQSFKSRNAHMKSHKDERAAAGQATL